MKRDFREKRKIGEVYKKGLLLGGQNPSVGGEGGGLWPLQYIC